MDCDELYVSYLFPPSNQASGITVFKRIIENNKKVDVLQGEFSRSNEFDEHVEKYINNRYTVSIDEKFDLADFIYKFIDKGINKINNNYKKIYSRSWLMANHFLACEYKFSHPNTIWTAEFSDPLIFDLNNKPKSYKQMIITDEKYISRINNKINELELNFPLIEYNESAYFIAEYIVYLFADRIIFTNKNQQEIMLNQFPIEIKEHVLQKSEIKPHPTLPDNFYQIKNVNLELDDNCLNIAYFGNDYYSKRNFESLFYAVESLNHKYKDKIKIYLYISNDNLLKKLIPSDNFIVKKPMDYLDFLNATTKFDVLIVNDAITKGNYKLNPYLPSKLSDYLGSGSDIWALYEKGSTLSNLDLKYKSDLSNYDDCLNEFKKILTDYGFNDENCSINEDYITNRLTSLNELYENEFNKNIKLNRKIKELKKESSSSISWNPFKKIKK